MRVFALYFAIIDLNTCFAHGCLGFSGVLKNSASFETGPVQISWNIRGVELACTYVRYVRTLTMEN